MGRALKLSLLMALLAAALLAFACGKTHVAGRGAIQAANSDSPQSLEDAQSALDALECPAGVDAALWAQLKAALKTALNERSGSGDLQVATPLKGSRTGDRESDRTTSAPPTGEANRVNDLRIADNGDGTFTLSWHYRNLGDYDQNGTVAVEDIIPLAQHFGKTWASGEENTLPAVIDGSANGKVGVEDVTPLAVNFGANVDHYAIEGAQAQDGAWEAVAEVAQSSGASDGRLAYEHVLADTPFRWYRAVPADAASVPGELSNSALSPAFQEWVHTWGGVDWEEASRCAISPHGEVYAAGITYSFGCGFGDALLLGYSSTGKLITQRTWGGLEQDGATALATGENGSIYVGGYTNSFGFTEGETFVVGYTPDVVLAWQTARRSDESEHFHVPTDLCIASDGGILLTGRTSNSPDRILLLKCAPDGTLIWQRTWFGVGAAGAAAVCTDSNGDIYIAGVMLEGLDRIYDTVLLKYSADGDLLWHRIWGGNGWDTLDAIAVDSSGDIYATGLTDSFGVGSLDVLLLKYSPEGELLWQTTWGTSEPDEGHAIAIDDKDAVYIAGHTSNFTPTEADALLLKFSSTGTLLVERTWSSPNSESLSDILIDSNGMLYIVGNATDVHSNWASIDGTVSCPNGAIVEPDSTAGVLEGIESTPWGIENTPQGVEDEGGGDGDILIMKIDPMRWE